MLVIDWPCRFVICLLHSDGIGETSSTRKKISPSQGLNLGLLDHNLSLNGLRKLLD